jgi:hypothetical protein
MAVGNAYRRFDFAVQGVRPGPANMGKSDVPAAHYNILSVLRSTMDATQGLKPITVAEAMLGLTLPAQALRDVETAALNTVVRMKPIISLVGERAQIQRALVDQSEAHAQWADAFKALVPPSPQQTIGQGMTDQVLDAYNKAIILYSFD